MPDSAPAKAEIRTLDRGYAREARALLYEAYRQDPTVAYLFEADRPGYEKRMRVMVRERVRQHFYQQLPALGLLRDDRLIGIALIAPPQRRLGVTESWAWRLRMLIGTGLRCTRRFLEYHDSVMACRPNDSVHVLPLLALHPEAQEQVYAEQLITAVHNWCAVDEHSEGVVLDTGNPRYLAFYQSQGYTKIGEIAVGPLTEHVFFHPNPEVLTAAA